MSTQDSFDEKYFVRLAEILFLGSEEVLERAVSLVSRIHCLQDWWWPREESASILLFACCPLFSFHFSFFKRRISIDRGSEEDSQYWFGEKVFLSQVSRSPKRKFFDKSFFGKKVFLSQVSRSRGRRVEWVLRMFDCQMEPGNSITKTPPLSSNKKGAHSLIEPKYSHSPFAKKNEEEFLTIFFSSRSQWAMFTKSEAGFVLLMDPKNETKMGDKIQTHYWQFPGKQPGKMTELRQSFCEEFLIRSPGLSVPRKRCFCYTLISPIFSFFCLSFAKRRFTKMAE